MTDFIPFNKPSTAGKELHYVAEAIQGQQLAGDGEFGRRCEQLIEELTGAPRVLVTTSCTSALEMAAILLDLAPGDEVILPSYTFVSTANAFRLQNATLKFVDIRPDTLNIDETQIEGAVSERTRVVVPIHYAGVCSEMSAIGAIAAKYQLRVVEDAAQGVNATYQGRYQGTFGDFGAFSFHETKNFICGEGGALVINDPSDIERAEFVLENGVNLRQWRRGEAPDLEWRTTGSSYALPELLAAFLLAQLEQMDAISARRAAVYHRYLSGLTNLRDRGLVELPQIPKHCRSNHHLFHILVETLDRRTALLEHMREQGIQSVFHYVPLHTSPMGQQQGYRPGMLPVTEDLADRLIRLPLSADMTEAQVDRIVASIHEFFQVRFA